MDALYHTRFGKLTARFTAIGLLLAALWSPPEALADGAANEQTGTTASAGVSPAGEDAAGEAPDQEASPVFLRPVVVTATRTAREVFNVPQSVSVVTARDMERQPRTTIAEQLQDIPGIQVSDGGMGGGAKRVSIRGEAPSRVLVLIDGMKISEQKSMDGSMIMINPLNVENIEVIKGPASVLYGSDAIGGVINIITKKGGERPVQGTLAVTYDGSNNSATPYGALYGSYKGFGYRISGDYTDAGDKRGGSGRIDESSYMQRNLSAYLDYSWDTGKIGAGYDQFWTHIRIPGTVTGTYSIDMRLPRWKRERYYAFIEQEKISDWFAKVKLTGYYQKTEKDFWNHITIPMGFMGTAWMHPYTKNEQDTYGLNLQTDWTLGDHYVIAGVDYLYDGLDASSETTGLMPDSPIPFPLRPYHTYYTYDGDQRTLALFLQDEWSFHRDWTATLGLRQTWLRSELSDTNDPTIKEESSSDNHMVGSLGLVYSGFEDWRLRALYSQGYRYPLLNQLYIGTTHGSDGTTYPNPDLDPETSHNFEIGARYDANGLQADLGIFYNLSDNYINTRSIPGTSDYIFENVSEAETFGVELTAAYTYEPWGLTPYLSGAYMHRTFDRGSSGGKTSKTGDPEWSGRVGLRYERELTPLLSFHADVFGRFACRAEEKASDGEVTEHAGWGTANLAVGVRMGEEKNYFVDLNINNLFNKRYALASSNLEEPGLHAVLRMGLEF